MFKDLTNFDLQIHCVKLFLLGIKVAVIIDDVDILGAVAKVVDDAVVVDCLRGYLIDGVVDVVDGAVVFDFLRVELFEVISPDNIGVFEVLKIEDDVAEMLTFTYKFRLQPK